MYTKVTFLENEIEFNIILYMINHYTQSKIYNYFVESFIKPSFSCWLTVHLTQYTISR